MRSRPLPRHAHAAPAPEKKERNFLVSSISAIIIILLVNAIWPEVIPISSTQVWTMRGTVMEWLTLSWPIFAWGGGFTFLAGLFRKMDYRERQRHAGHAFLGGLVISLWAGVVEEVCFRWLLFLSGIATTIFTNWLMSGWVVLGLIGLFAFGIGAASKNGLIALFFGIAAPVLTYAMFGLPPHIPEFVYTNLMGPLVNWVTFGTLHDTLYHPAGFAVGASLIAANAFFRDGHKYQGIIGIVNSWCLGMFFFYLMLNYGLPAAILVHFLYDVVVFSTSALVLAWRNDL